jgi:hypothetical protein
MERHSFSMLCAIQPIVAVKHGKNRAGTRFHRQRHAAQQTKRLLKRCSKL